MRKKVRFLLGGAPGIEYERRRCRSRPARPTGSSRSTGRRHPALIDDGLVLAESNAIRATSPTREGRDDLCPQTRRARAVDWLLDAVAMTCGPPAARSTRPPTASARSASIGAKPPRPEDVARRDRRIAATAGAFSRLLGDGGYARSAASRWPTARRCRRSGACCTRARWQDHPRCGSGPRPSADTRLAAGRRREGGARVITSRANARVKAARALGEAKERRRTGLFVDEGEDALRAALGAASRPSRRSSTRPRQRSHRRRARRGRHEVLRCTARSWPRSRRSRRTSRAVGVLRANDLPPLAAGRRRARSG